MGGVEYTGLLPKDVANLTAWQINNDYFRNRAELSKAIAKAGKPDAGLDADKKPTREAWIRFRKLDYPDWTDQQLHDEADKVLKIYEESQ